MILHHPLANHGPMLLHSLERLPRPGRPDAWIAVFTYARAIVRWDGEQYTTVPREAE